MIPPPPGFELDQPTADAGTPPPPPGFELDAPLHVEQSKPSTFDNAISDVEDLGKGALQTGLAIAKAPYEIPKAVGQTALGVMRGQPIGETPMGQQASQLGEMVKGAPRAIFNRGKEIVTHPIKSFQEHPVKTALDVASVVAPIAGKALEGVDALAAPRSMFRNAAQDAGVNALGYGKGALKTPQNVARARQVAQTMMDEGILNGTASHETMAEGAHAMAEESGEAIGAHLQKMGSKGFLPTEELVGELESLRPRSETGVSLQGGAHDAINRKIDNAVETVKAYNPVQSPDLVTGVSGQAPQALSFPDANHLKGTLQDMANFKSNKDATLLDRIIAGKTREVLDRNLEKVSSGMGDAQGHQDFLAHKKRYSAAMQAQDPIYNRLSSEIANNKMSLTDWILLAPEAAAGNPGKAIAALGGKKLLQSYGPQMKASMFNKAAQVSQKAVAEAPFIADVASQKHLDKDTARTYLDQANGDKKLARELARKAGYSW